MGKFQIVRTGRTVSGRAPAVRADIDVRTGEAGVGQAIGQLGLGIAKIAIQYDITQAQTQLSMFQRKANEEINRLAISFDTNLDPETYQAEYKKSLAAIHSLIPKNRRAAKNAQLWLNAKEPAWLMTVDKARLARADDNWMAELFVRQTAITQTGQIGSFPAFVKEGITAGRIDKSDAVKILAKTKIAATKVEIWNNATTTVRPDGEIDWPAAVEWFSKAENIKGISPEIIDSLLEDARTQANEQKRRDKQQDDIIGEGFLDLLINKLDPTKPQLTFDMIANSNLSFDAKTEWFTKLRTFDSYSEGELKEAFTDKGEVLADIYDKIDAGTLADELDTMVGKGLSPTTAQRIKKEIRAPYEKDTDQLFKRIFGWRPELGFENDLSGFLYEKALREWQAEVKAQDATGEKIIEIGRSIVRPYFLEHLEAVMPGDTNISRMMELALGEEIEEEPEVERPEIEEPEAAELYKIGETRPDEKGQVWEYIGDNKWQSLEEFDPEGSGYDYETAGAFGGKPNKEGHWGSLDPRTGMVLKGRKNSGWDLMVREEKRLGNKIIKKGNRYYSVKK